MTRLDSNSDGSRASKHLLGDTIVRQLAEDGFRSIGRFEIRDERHFEIHFDLKEAEDWCYSIYAFVSFANAGVIVRIGKCEQKLKSRLRGYKVNIGDALSGALGHNEMYRGGTKPWEPGGWLNYSLPFGGGMLFAKQIKATGSMTDVKKLLADIEVDLIQKHNPPLCGDSIAGRATRAEWIAKHGRPMRKAKRVSA